MIYEDLRGMMVQIIWALPNQQWEGLVIRTPGALEVIVLDEKQVLTDNGKY
jgi:hypothetical protein